ncbi:MAG: hypothetical protein IPP15_14875 [Saprospiraceae bacterium]|uniref:Uncharacterized protein n=1 Tax=Candidatus Opimibacter skivensis TaxID=2982028 RepID=A0A9D7SWU8_9BACT|nr:hypothetical protein [Candidatus Opimibacter skivensis]
MASYLQVEARLNGDLNGHPILNISHENSEALKIYFQLAQSFTNKDSLLILNPLFYEVDWESGIPTGFFGDSSFVFNIKDDLYGYTKSFGMQIVMSKNSTSITSIRSLFYICDASLNELDNQKPGMHNFSGHVIESNAKDELLNLYCFHQGDIVDISSIKTFSVVKIARHNYGYSLITENLQTHLLNWLGSLLKEKLISSFHGVDPRSFTGIWDNDFLLPCCTSHIKKMPCQSMVEAFLEEYNQIKVLKENNRLLEVFDLAYLIGDFDGHCSSKDSLDEFIRDNIYYNWYLENIDGGPDYNPGGDWNNHSPIQTQFFPTNKKPPDRF